MKYLSSIKRYGALPVASGVLVVVPTLTAFAAEAGGAAISAKDWAPVIEALTGQISVTAIVGALATFVAAAIGIVFMWWGLRKAIRSLMGAFRKGKLSV